MDEDFSLIEHLCEEKISFQTYIFDKNNAKLGDALVNFIYSLAKSIVLKRNTGIKVSDYILSEAYKNSLWFKKKKLLLKGKKGRIGDIIEAMILYFWLTIPNGLEKFVNILTLELKNGKFKNKNEESINAIDAFKELLNFFYNYSE